MQDFIYASSTIKKQGCNGCPHSHPHPRMFRLHLDIRFRISIRTSMCGCIADIVISQSQHKFTVSLDHERAYDATVHKDLSILIRTWRELASWLLYCSRSRVGWVDDVMFILSAWRGLAWIVVPFIFMLSVAVCRSASAVWFIASQIVCSWDQDLDLDHIYLFMIGNIKN